MSSARSGPTAGPSAALDVALRFLAVRPRSEAEVRRRLERGPVRGRGRRSEPGFDAAAIDAALARLREDGLLDDAAFARYWLEQRRTFRPRGARLLQAELRQRGIGSQVAVEATATIEDKIAERDAYRAARKRALQLHSAGLDERGFRTRMGQYLARRGFDWDTISLVVARLWNERSPAPDGDGDTHAETEAESEPRAGDDAARWL